MQDGNSRHLEISRRYQETCGCATIQDPFISYKETIYSKKHQRHWSPQSAPASRTLQRCGDEMHWNILTESHWFSSSTGHGWWRSHVSPNPFSNLSQCPSQLMLSALAPKCQGFDCNSAVKAIQWSFMIQFNWHLRHLAPVWDIEFLQNMLYDKITSISITYYLIYLSVYQAISQVQGMLAHHFRQGTGQSADGLRCRRSLELQSGASPETRQGFPKKDPPATGLEHNMCLLNLHMLFICPFVQFIWNDMGMDQYLLIPFLGGWTSIYQLFWCSPGVQGFDTLPYEMILNLLGFDSFWSKNQAIHLRCTPHGVAP